MVEEWKDVEGYEGLYQVSNLGRVKTLLGRNGVTILKGQENHGYLRVQLHKNKKSKKFFIHVLVANAFVSNPNNLPEVNHKDEKHNNNEAVNLEWCTHSYNINYGTRNKKVSEKNGKTVYQYDKEGNFIKEWINSRKCQKAGYKYRSISACCNGKRKTHKGYIWTYTKIEKGV